ncbi:ABC transporter substrate-binding protein [Phytoactinopolyspora endophytica]|uniref:ABC transporter substrate-binding protein n=1 Tax=Phytoactinopolyspora endophytica TaxID=1642495 RepID=UPI00101D892A|nr:extracellular solute-binding protein [Phytoactinopolyspora endophytica]
MRSSRMTHRSAVTAVVGLTMVTIASCGGGGDDSGGSGAGGDGASDLSLLMNVENNEIPGTLTTLSENACADQNDAAPLSVETVPQTNLDQQLQLLAGQGGLPTLYAAGNAPDLTKTLAESGHVLDFQEALTELDVIDNVEPAAISTIEALYGGFNVLPFEYNIEGIWYNTAMFDEHGVTVPETWDDLVAAAQAFADAGITPFSASGDQGWPITRLIGNYLFRSIGPDALQRVADGEASLTDPEYVEAAQAVADLGSAEFFGQGVGSIDMDTSTNEFISGNAAMYYMGSWALSDFNDDERNDIGVDNIGFMPFPDVEGGAGDRSQLAANVGLPVTMNAEAYGDATADWLSCIAENYGSAALEEYNRVSGFTVNNPVDDVGQLTQEVQDQVSATDEAVLWFEALFNTEATNTSQRNAAPLVTGSISAEEFMGMVQDDLG